AFLRPLNAADFGVGLLTTSEVLWLVDTGLVAAVTPRVVVLEIGTVNLGAYGQTPDQIAGGIDAIVATLHQHLPFRRVIVQGILPLGVLPWDPFRAAANATNLQVAQSLADPSLSPGTTYLDFGWVFLQPNGVLNMALTTDTIHPNLFGYIFYTIELYP